jgi:hypothetical protein
MLDSALCGIVTASIINKTTHYIICTNLSDNETHTLILQGHQTHPHAFNQLFTTTNLHVVIKPIFYEENFKLFFVRPCNPYLDKMQKAGNR